MNNRVGNWQSYKTASNVSWMNDMIDWSHWVPITGEADWLLDNYDEYDVFRPGEIKQNPHGYWHPSPHGHKLFSDKVLLPFVRNLYDTV